MNSLTHSPRCRKPFLARKGQRQNSLRRGWLRRYFSQHPLALEALEERVMLSADPVLFEQAFSQTVDQLASGTFLAGLESVDDPGPGAVLPLIAIEDGQEPTSISSVFQDKLDVELRQPILAYFFSDNTPTVAELGAAVDAETAISVNNVVDINNVSELTLTYSSDVAVTRQLDLNTVLADEGISVDEPIDVTVTVSTSFDLRIGVDQTTATTADAAGYMQIENLQLAAVIDEDLNASVLVGMLEAEIAAGTFALNAMITGGMTSTISLADLATTAPGTLLDPLSTTSLIDADLPLTASFGSHTFGPSSVQIGDSDIFADPAPLVTFTGDLTNFARLGANNFYGLLDSLGNWFVSLSSSELTASRLPLADASLGDAFSFNDGFASSITGVLDNPRIKATAAAPASGKLQNDLTFSFTVNDAATVQVTITATSTSGNNSVGDLASTLETALLAALNSTAFAGQVEAGHDGSQLTIRATSDDISQLRIEDAEVLGFASSHNSVPLSFDSLQDLADLLPGLSGGAYDPSTNTVTFELAFSHTLDPQSLPMAFDQSFGPLMDIQTSSTITAQAQVGGAFTVGIVLDEVGSTFSLTGSTLLTDLNGGLGVIVKDGLSDIQVTLSDGTKYEVDIPDPDPASDPKPTVSDVIAALQNPSGNKLQVTIDDVEKRFMLTDTSGGSGKFKVAQLNSSLAGQPYFGLGINQADDDGDGVIAGVSIHGDTLADQFFIQDSTPNDPTLTGTVDLVATDIDALARFGFIGVGVLNGVGTASAGIDLNLQDPKTVDDDGRIFLPELYDGLIQLDANTPAPLDPTPAVTGVINNLTLPINTNPFLPNALGLSPEVDVQWSDVSDENTLVVSHQDLGPLPGFEYIDTDKIIEQLREFQQKIDDVENGTSLNIDLPLLGKDLSEIIDLSDRFGTLIDAIQQAHDLVPIYTLQDLAQLLEDEIGGDPISTVTQGFASPQYDIDLSLGREFSDPNVPLNLELPGFVAGLVDPDGTLSVNAEATLNVGFRIDVTDTANPKFVIKDETELLFGVRVNGNGIEFDTAVGPLGVFIRDGSARLDDGAADPNNAGNATWTIGVTGDQELADLDLLDFQTDIAGKASATLPVYGPTVTEILDPNLPNIELTIDDLANIAGTTTLTGPDFADAIENKLGDLHDNLNALMNGWESFFALLETAVDTGVFDVSIPLIGNQLTEVATFILDIRDLVLDEFDQTLVPNDAGIRQAFYNALGPGELNILEDYNNDGFISLEDIPVSNASVEYTLPLHKALTLIDIPVGFDIGLPALGLDVDGDIRLELGFDWTIIVGLSKEDGVYFKTNEEDELTIGLKATIPGFDAEGSLGFLQVNVTDGPGDPTNPLPPSQLTGGFVIDFLDPGNDGKLTLTEILTQPDLTQLVDASFTGGADINLNVVTSFDDDANFPSLHADLLVDWNFVNADTSSGVETFGGVPEVQFVNVQLNMGEFFSEFVAPVVEVIQAFLEPIDPLLGLLNGRLPVISDLAGSDVSIVDIASSLGNPLVTAIAFIVQVGGIINDIPIVNGDVLIDLGDLNFADPNDGTPFDIRDRLSLGDFDYNNLLTVDVVENIAATLAGIDGLEGASQFFADKAALLGEFLDGGTKFSFPLFEEPTSALGLLLGQDVNLVEFKPPTFKIDVSYSEFFPLFAGILGVRLSGAVQAGIDFAFGYDTRGLRRFVESGFSDPLLVGTGLFVKDSENPDGTGPDIDELYARFAIAAAAAAKVVVAEAGVEGGIEAGIAFNLNDPDSDGKVYVDELFANIKQGPTCLFDASGDFKAYLEAYVRVEALDVTIFEESTTIAEIYKDFNYSCGAVSPILATNSSGTLHLNMGPRAGQRLEVDTEDGNEVFTIRPGSNANEVIVSAFGYEQLYSNVIKIVGDGGAGEDKITVHPGVTVPVELRGGGERDVLQAGGGPAKLFGDGGDDELYGSPVDDVMEGGTGKDLLLGYGGADTLKGGDDNDTIKGGQGDDEMWGEGGVDLMFGGSGNDVLIGGLAGDTLKGERGNDILYGNLGADDLEGGHGDDTISGGLGVDTIHGDLINGGGFGRDLIFGDFEPDLNDLLAGNVVDCTDTAAGDVDSIYGGGGIDVICGDGGADHIDGGSGGDTIKGGLGADVIVGGPGSDTIWGNKGIDTIYAALESGFVDPPEVSVIHTIHGGDGADIIHGDRGDDTITGGEGADHILAYGGNNTIDGGSGMDFIRTLGGNDDIDGGADGDDINSGAGDDTIDGQGGDDTIVAGLGSDTITGGEGGDTIIAGMWKSGSTSETGSTHIIDAGPGNDTVYADFGDDIIATNGGDDLVYSYSGIDLIDTGAGKDTVYAGDGDDNINTGTEMDTVYAGAGDDVADLGEGDDHFWGGPGNDTAYGRGGNDTMRGEEGDDKLYGEAGGDEIWGGDDNDLIVGDAGNDQLYGDAGSDVIWGGIEFYAYSTFMSPSANLVNPPLFDEKEALFWTGYIPPKIVPAEFFGQSYPGIAGDGDDFLRGGSGIDWLFGGGDIDNLDGGEDSDFVDGGSGDEVASMGEWGGLVTGGPGDDVVFGGANDDFVDGGDGIDQVYGDDGGVSMFGHGSDTVRGGAGDDGGSQKGQRLYGGAGRDFLHAYAPSSVSDNEKDQVGDQLFGGPGGDELSGNLRRDVLVGDGGNDNMFGDGLAGPDYAENNDAARTGGDDLMYGLGGEDYMFGGGGNDTMWGGADTDWLEGQDGFDQIYGGEFIDVMVLDTDPTYSHFGDAMHGHFGNVEPHDTLPLDDNSTDIMLIRGTGDGDTIQLGETDVTIVAAGDAPINGQLSAAATFDLEVVSTSFSTASPVQITVPPDGSNKNIDDLVADINTELISGFPGGEVVASRVGRKIALSTHELGRDAIFTLSIPGTDIITTPELGFEDGDLGVPLLTVYYPTSNDSERRIFANWRDRDGVPVVEQFRVAGLNGDDTIGFMTGDAELDFSLLAHRNDFIGVFDGGPGDDHLTGGGGRDRLDGGQGDDTLQGFAGDDRLWGQEGDDHMYAGGGNDDLLGGPGDNFMYAWSQYPYDGGQFGVFVDADGMLYDNDGSPGVSPPRELEDTGLNRMLGEDGDDNLYAGTGVDFLYGDGGNDTLYRTDGSEFEDADGGLVGDAWKEFAKENDKVWYYSATNADDEISLDFVTEPGVLVDRHLITRRTTNNGNVTFAAQLRLDFDAVDENDQLIWDPVDVRLDLDALDNPDQEVREAKIEEIQLNGGLLPGEGDFLVIIIDALDGDDSVTVGPTVQKTVWVDAGAGDDVVDFLSGNAILSDIAERPRRNDQPDQAFELLGPAVIVGTAALAADGVLHKPATFNLTASHGGSKKIVVEATPLIDPLDEDPPTYSRATLVAQVNAALRRARLTTLWPRVSRVASSRSRRPRLVRKRG